MEKDTGSAHPQSGHRNADAEQSRVLWIFNHYAEEPSTGTGLRHYHLARKLGKLGWKVIVFAASTIHQSDANLIENDEPYVVRDIDGITFVHVKTRLYSGNGKQRILNILDYVRGCKRICPEFSRPSAILASSVHPLAWYLGSKFSKRYRIPWVCEVRDLWPESLIEFGVIGRRSLLAKAIRAYEYHAYTTCDALVFTMPGGIDYIEEQGWADAVPKEKVHWISNGIDLDRFERERVEHRYHDAAFDDDRYFRFVYCGSMGESDGLDRYLDAIKDMHGRGAPDARLFLFGDGPYRKGLEKKCSDENIEGVFFMGRVEKKYIPSIVSRADVNLLSVQWTGLLKYGCSFNKLYDYLAAGRPIVSNVSFGRSDFEDRKCCVALRSPDESLSSLLMGLYGSSDEDRAAMGRRSADLAKEYDFSSLAARFAVVLDSACFPHR